MKYMLRNIERKNDPAPWCDVKLAFDDNFAEMLLEHFPQPYSVDYTGARSCTNKFRKFVTRVETPELAKMFEDWQHDDCREYFTNISGNDCSTGHLRIELCMDGPGFYLDRHIDIPEKLITLQVYLGEGNDTWGTSIYDAQHKLFYTNEFRHNTGWMSFGGSPLIHGVEKNAQVDGARRSIIINYVVGDWKDTHQLY
jgi:hypothetical protein